MASFLGDNEDLRYYFERGMDWGPLVTVTRSDFQATADAVDFYRDVADLVGRFAAEQVAPHAAEIDRGAIRIEGGEVVMPARLESIFQQLKGLELHGLCLPKELGGMNCPLLLYMINTELLARAEVSVMAHNGFHGGMAMAMLAFSIREGTTTFDGDGRIQSTRFGSYIDEIVRGDAWGCMDITEPDAGSDMAALRCRGEVDAAGNWVVSGQKIFITSGHGKYHFVIARTEQPKDADDPFSGLAGLSMFLVPTYEDGASGRRRIVPIDRVEEKLGHHGSVTAALNFDRAPAHLIGKRGEGFRHMLTLMNNARIGVGFESIGLCEASVRLARVYASERRSMGKPIARHEMIADYLDEMETDVLGLRALAMHAAFHEEMAQKLALMGKLGFRPGGQSELEMERRRRHHERKSRRVTPLLKYLAAEKAVETSRRCLQIHGGNGYMKDYPAEKLLRDAVVMPIYEGTSQIQALMAMKDTLSGIMSHPQQFVRRIAQARWRSVRGRDPLERRVAKLQHTALAAQQFLITRTAAMKLRSLADKPLSAWTYEVTKNWDPKRDFALAMLHAERLTRLLADEAIAEELLHQTSKHPERRAILERHLERAEPRVQHLHDEITTIGERLLRTLAEGPDLSRAAS